MLLLLLLLQSVTVVIIGLEPNCDCDETTVSHCAIGQLLADADSATMRHVLILPWKDRAGPRLKEIRLWTVCIDRCLLPIPRHTVGSLLIRFTAFHASAFALPILPNQLAVVVRDRRK